MLRKRLGILVWVLVLVLPLEGLSLYAQLELPPTTGPYAVGRMSLHWVDNVRPEERTAGSADRREVGAEVWYPAEAGTGQPAAYVPELARLADGLVGGGELNRLVVVALRFVRAGSQVAAEVARAEPAYPVLLLSPGNATNAEFYAALAEDLASHGYVVVGLNHPYDVAAVALSDGRIAQYDPDDWLQALAERQAAVAHRIDVRVADAVFALDQLAAIHAASDGPLAGRLDLARIGMVGHSLGGIAAAQACVADARLKACVNLDGLQAGGPFSARPQPELPAQPFMLITKEAALPAPVLALFEALPAPSYRVLVAGARHGDFTDGGLLEPALLPLPGPADRTLAATRDLTRAFFDQSLRGAPSALLAGAASGQCASAGWPCNRVNVWAYGPSVG